MTTENFGICITALISTISLLISLANYRKDKPKLKIKIADRKLDCFFGKTIHEMHPSFSACICGAHINIINNSPVAITISSASIIIGKERMQLIDNRNSYWDNIDFFFEDDNGEMTTDGFGINYNECGLRLPCKVNAYDTLTATALFHDFHAKIKKRCKGMIVLNTAIGNVKKKITMIEYNKDREEFEYQDYLCYCRSLEEIN